jgi:hypothetical protein
VRKPALAKVLPLRDAGFEIVRGDFAEAAYLCAAYGVFNVSPVPDKAPCSGVRGQLAGLVLVHEPEIAPTTSV